MEEFRICSETGTKITRKMVISCISDTYKSINGIRPRWMNFDEYTFDELGEYLGELSNQAKEAWKQEVIFEREQRKIRSRSEKRYQKIRKDAKTPFSVSTYSLGEILKQVI